ncbi:MAG: peptide deformylase, partial [Candidatus Methanomethylophilaceae archaeon]|nr:peptide deformylase [Candidatus Methanomethylophilaceae archaeon]
AKLLEDMKETLAVADGCGLAAPQVGVNKRLVIVDGIRIRCYRHGKGRSCC